MNQYISPVMVAWFYDTSIQFGLFYAKVSLNNYNFQLYRFCLLYLMTNQLLMGYLMLKLYSLSNTLIMIIFSMLCYIAWRNKWMTFSFYKM